MIVASIRNAVVALIAILLVVGLAAFGIYCFI
jgi:hypothetical protein